MLVSVKNDAQFSFHIPPPFFFSLYYTSFSYKVIIHLFLVSYIEFTILFKSKTTAGYVPCHENSLLD